VSDVSVRRAALIEAAVAVALDGKPAKAQEILRDAAETARRIRPRQVSDAA